MLGPGRILACFSLDRFNNILSLGFDRIRPIFNVLRAELCSTTNIHSFSSLTRTTRMPNVSQARNSITAYLHRFAKTTSAHGYSRAVAGGSQRSRWLWILLLITANCFFFYLSYMILHEYQEQYVAVGFEFSEEKFVYPQITLCAPFTYSLLKLTRALKADKINDYLGSDLVEKLKATLESERLRLYSSSVFLSAKPSAKELWINFEDIVINCSISSGIESCIRAKTIRLPETPTCFTITINSTTIQTMSSFSSVKIFLLTETITHALIPFEIGKYVSQIRSQIHNGIKFFVHPAGMRPIDLSSDHVTLSPGYYYDISLHRTVTYRVSRFFGKKRCMKENKRIAKECPRYKSVSYTAAMCRAAELHAQIRSGCNCSINIGCNPDKFGVDRNCFYLKSWEDYHENMACLRKEVEEYLFLKNHCLPECQEENFEKIVRSAPLSDSFALELFQYLRKINTMPSKNIGDPVLHDYVESLKHMYQSSQEHDNALLINLTKAVKKNFITLTLHFESGSTSVSREKYLISPMTLISNIGGCLGLWVGCSIISVAEFLDFFIDLLGMLISKSCREGPLRNWRRKRIG